MRSNRCAVQNQGITLKLVKATEKGKKLKQGFKVTPVNQTRNFHTEGCAFTECAN